MNNEQILSELTKAAQSLLLMSETDAPLTPFCWHRPEQAPATSPSDEMLPCTKADVINFTNRPADVPVETRDVETFFRAMSQDQIGDPPDLLAMRARFRDLQTRLPELLTHLIVFRVGRVHIDAYIVGVTPTADLAGLQTVQVET